MATNKIEGKKVAILATDGFEQSELFEPKKALEDAGAQTVEPRFTSKGFRYIQITGLSSPPALATAFDVHTDVSQAGTLASSASECI